MGKLLFGRMIVKEFDKGLDRFMVAARLEPGRRSPHRGSSAAAGARELVRFLRQTGPRCLDARHRQPLLHQAPVAGVKRLPDSRGDQGCGAILREFHDERPLREQGEELPFHLEPI